jgi:predicted pyridoxine 5'-phosphate oxidase superfamily flavin-nucleotide-binding protein
MQRYADIAFSPASQVHQRRRGSYDHYAQAASFPPPVGLGADERAFLADRDSFYLASVGPDGWPYVQHRGGPAGFIHVLDPTHIAWADRPGNRQFVTAGNLDGDDRVSMIAVDYPNRQRLKIYGHATFDAAPDPAQMAAVAVDGRLEGLVTVEVTAFDWNCPKYITPRYTADEVQAAVEPLHQRIRELEQRLTAP